MLAWTHLKTVLFIIPPTPSTAPFVMDSKEEMPADLDAIMLQQTDDAKEHVLLLEML